MFRRSISGTVPYTSRSDRLGATCDTLEITCKSGILIVGGQPRISGQQNPMPARYRRQPANPDQKAKISNTDYPDLRTARYSTPPKTETAQ
jgi:hypothetical protein